MLFRSFFADADILALTLDPSSPPAGGVPPSGSTPIYNWSWSGGTAPASVTAIFLQVVEVVPDPSNPPSGTMDVSIGTWIVPPTQNSFVHPANLALNPTGNYKWQVGFFHTTDGTLRDHGGEAKVGQVSFSRP